jgi:hypothetical protein
MIWASRRRTSSFVFSAIILWNPMPTPSITANRHAQPMAEFRAAFAPPLIAKAPPVKKPAITIHLLAVVPPSKFGSVFAKPCSLLQIPQNTISTSSLPGWMAHTSIIWIFLLPHSFNRTIECREKSTPYSEVAS